MVNQSLALEQEIRVLAKPLYYSAEKRTNFTKRLLDICDKVEDVDFLLIHSPGGFGSTPLEHLLEWERSVVDGICATFDRFGHNYLLTQHFRTRHNRWAHFKDMKEQAIALLTGKYSDNYPEPKAMAAELRFITKNFTDLKILLIGASQGAAFGNTVMRQITDLKRVYSIELGIFFPHKPRRVLTERTLAIDNNGTMPDPMSQRNLLLGGKAYVTAPYRWLKYKRQGNPKKFTYCINTPGHDYNWQYPEVSGRITNFLKERFNTK